MASEAIATGRSANGHAQPAVRGAMNGTADKVNNIQNGVRKENEYVNKLSRSWRAEEEKDMKNGMRWRIAIISFIFILAISAALLMQFYFYPNNLL